MIVVMTLFTTWGFTGLIVNEILDVEKIQSLFVWISCAIALVCSILGTRYLITYTLKDFP